jgi:peroxiredoxin family protein
MKLRELFEAAPAKKIVVVMPGGFHPFHPGHKSLYDWAVETFGRDNVYVAATNDTKSRPFPFNVKQALAGFAGVPSNRFIEVKSPFNALSYDNIISDPANTALVFVRSEKDKASHPLPDQVRKSDGNMGYLISYQRNNNLETADTHGYLAYGPTIDFNFSGLAIRSASELRAAWPEMSDEDKLQAANLMYPGKGEEASKMLDTALGINDAVPAESISETKPDMNKVLTALKKKLKDEGGAAGFDPLKAVAKKMDVNLTPAMLKKMSGIKMHRDGDYILEEVKNV